MVRSFFPGLYDFAVVSLTFSDVIVERSLINPNCIIIKARKPMGFLLDYLAERGFSADWLDKVCFKYNSDNSLSVFDK